MLWILKVNTSSGTCLLGLCSFTMSEAISTIYCSQSVVWTTWLSVKGYLNQTWCQLVPMQKFIAQSTDHKCNAYFNHAPKLYLPHSYDIFQISLTLYYRLIEKRKSKSLLVYFTCLQRKDCPSQVPICSNSYSGSKRQWKL